MPPVHDNGNVHCDLNARIQVYHPPMETRAALNGHSGTIHLTLIRSVSMAKIETPAKRVSPSVRDIYCYVASHLIPRDCITTRNKWKYTRDQFYTTSNYSIIINVLFLKRKIIVRHDLRKRIFRAYYYYIQRFIYVVFARLKATRFFTLLLVFTRRLPISLYFI